MDTAGNVYAAEFGGTRLVLKLPVGSSSLVALPFTGLRNPNGVAVDAVGNIYVTDPEFNGLLKLPAGSSTPVQLAIAGMQGAGGVAVDSTGGIFVTDRTSGAVFLLSPGQTTPVELPFIRGSTYGAADRTSVYTTDNANNQVLKAGDTITPDQLPFTGLDLPRAWRWIPVTTSTLWTSATDEWSNCWRGSRAHTAQREREAMWLSLACGDLSWLKPRSKTKRHATQQY